MNKHTRSVSLIDGHTEDRTDAEIIKALQHCKRPTGKHDCDNCPYVSSRGMCTTNMLNDTIDLIDRKNNTINAFERLIDSQKAEIERLNIRNKTLTDISKKYDWKFSKAKSEAIKKFWERFDKVLCENIGPSKRVYWKISSDGNNLVKEMTEVSENG